MDYLVAVGGGKYATYCRDRDDRVGDFDIMVFVQAVKAYNKTQRKRLHEGHCVKHLESFGDSFLGGNHRVFEEFKLD